MRTPAMRICALVLAGVSLALACCSCSRAVKMSLVEPGDLTQVPGSGKSARFSRGDSIRTQDDGVLVVAGDSFEVFSRKTEHRGITQEVPAAIYERRPTSHSLRVMGYQPIAGRWQPWEGSVRARGDSLEFLRAGSHAHPLRRPTTADTLRVARRDVARVDLEQTDPTRTTLLILGTAAVFVGVTIAALASISGPATLGPIGF